MILYAIECYLSKGFEIRNLLWTDLVLSISILNHLIRYFMIRIQFSITNSSYSQSCPSCWFSGWALWAASLVSLLNGFKSSSAAGQFVLLCSSVGLWTFRKFGTGTPVSSVVRLVVRFGDNVGCSGCKSGSAPNSNSSYEIMKLEPTQKVS